MDSWGGLYNQPFERVHVNVQQLKPCNLSKFIELFTISLPKMLIPIFEVFHVDIETTYLGVIRQGLD